MKLFVYQTKKEMTNEHENGHENANSLSDSMWCPVLGVTRY